jgi:hypothetical protein
MNAAIDMSPPIQARIPEYPLHDSAGLNRFVGSGGEAFEDAEGFVVVGEQ